MRHHHLGYVYGLDPGAWCRMILGIVLWFLGFPEQAKVQEERALAWAREVGQQNGIGLVLVFMTMLHHLRREPEATVAAAADAIEVSERYGLPFNRNYAYLIRGWTGLDVDHMRRILEVHTESGQVAAMPYYRSILAEVEAAHGRLDAALKLLDECLMFAKEHGDRYYMAEVHRLKGVFLLQQGGSAEAGESCLREAITTAREQGARMPELQATIALCRSLRHRGKVGEVHARLAELYGEFTEGLSTPALQEARALLAEIGG
jgi:hypothetical protein